MEKYTKQYQLSEYEAGVLTEEREMADYFEEIIGEGSGVRPKPVSNWLLGPVKSWLNENKKEITEFPLPPKQIGTLVQLVEEGKLGFSVVFPRLFPRLLQQPSKDPRVLAEEEDLIQQADTSVLEPVIDKVLDKYADKVVEYKKGKKGLLSLFVGEVM